MLQLHVFSFIYALDDVLNLFYLYQTTDNDDLLKGMNVNIDVKITSDTLLAACAVGVSLWALFKSDSRDTLSWKRSARLPFYAKLEEALKDIRLYVYEDSPKTVSLPQASVLEGLFREARVLGLTSMSLHIFLLETQLKRASQGSIPKQLLKDIKSSESTIRKKMVSEISAIAPSDISRWAKIRASVLNHTKYRKVYKKMKAREK